MLKKIKLISLIISMFFAIIFIVGFILLLDKLNLVSINNVDDGAASYTSLSSTTVGSGNGDILASCEAVKDILIARNVHYSKSPNRLIYNDIEKQFNEGKYFCCSSYVSAVLFYSGLLTAEQMNPYNYNNSTGIPGMLKAAGWKELIPSAAQPGDVAIQVGQHSMIYAGDGKVWDNYSCVISSGGRAPTGKTRRRSIRLCRIFRAP